MDKYWLLDQIREVEDEELLCRILMEADRCYERLRPEQESVHLLLPKYDRKERKRQLDFCRARLLLEEFEE